MYFYKQMAKFCVYEYMAIKKENQEQFSLKNIFFSILLSKFNTYPWAQRK